MPIPVMGTPLYEYDHMNTANKEVIKIGHVFGTIAKRTKKHTFVRFKNNDIPRLQSKEDFINSHLIQWARDGKIPMYTSHNKKINGCSARPDFGYNLATHWLLLEVDEHQHSMPYRHYAGYRPREEFQRMCDLCAAAYKPVVILRYNPDAFQINGKTQQIETADRVALLLARLEYYLTLAVFDDFITAEYLFYSRCPPADDNPLIGCFSFSDPLSMNNWIELFGTNWDTSTLCDAIECAQFKLQAARTTANDQTLRQRIFCQKAAIIDDSSEYLCTQYKNTTIEMFDAWLPEQRTLYAGNKMLDAYNRLNRFRSYGPNHTDALANLNARYIHSSSDQFDMNQVAIEDLDACVHAGHYDYFAYTMSDEMLRMYTGTGDPYQVNFIFQSVIWSNLECRRDDKRMIVSESKSKDIFNLYKRWIALDPLHHTPSRVVPETDSLDFKQAMTILNQILRFMNVLELIDSNKQKGRRGEIPDRLLIMDKYSTFADDVDSADKPVLDQWNKLSSSDTTLYVPSVISGSYKRKRRGSKQMMPIETHNSKQRKRKERNEKIEQIKHRAMMNQHPAM